MRISITIAFAALIGALTPVAAVFGQQPAAAEDVSLATELARHKYALTLDGGKLEGPGAEFLVREASTAEFVLIGEDHGIGSIPDFAAALYRRIAPLGFGHLVVEAGPLSGAAVERMARSADPHAAFAQFNREHPFALPFFSWLEECRLAETAVRSSAASRPVIWALDQEFVLSAPVHFARLAAIAPNPRAKALAVEYQRRAENEYAAMVASHNPSDVFLVAAKAEDFDRLESAFAARPGSEAARILGELRVSWEIYVKNGDGRGYQSNLQRSELMKQHFMEYYRAAERAERRPPRAVFKFGAFHMKRGRSVTNVFDIGNLASELAVSNGSHSFHILVIAASGTQNGYYPFVGNPDDKHKPIDAVGSFDFMDVKPLLDAAGATGVSVIDLRPLRAVVGRRSSGEIDAGLKDAIFGYDAVLVIHDAKAATLFE